MRIASRLAALALLLPLAARADGSDAEAANAYVFTATESPIKLKQGAPGAVFLRVAPKPGAHVSPDAPLTVNLSGGAAIDLPKLKLTRADSKPYGDQGVEVTLPFSAKAKGADELKASFIFYICLKDVCARQQKSLSFPVSID